MNISFTKITSLHCVINYYIKKARFFKMKHTFYSASGSPIPSSPPSPSLPSFPGTTHSGLCLTTCYIENEKKNNYIDAIFLVILFMQQVSIWLAKLVQITIKKWANLSIKYTYLLLVFSHHIKIFSRRYTIKVLMYFKVLYTFLLYLLKYS